MLTVGVVTVVSFVPRLWVPFGEDAFGGGGTWQSLLFAVLEATVMVTMSLWLFDLFRRGVTYQGEPAGRTDLHEGFTFGHGGASSPTS